MMLILSIALVACLTSQVGAFNYASMAIKMRSNAALHMGGGRSLEEKSMTKKMMFRNLREKLNTAAQIPGFFEVGEGSPVKS